MAQNSDITYNVIVNEQKAVSGIDNIDDSIDDLTKSLDNLDSAVSGSMDDLADTIENTGDEYDDLAKKTKKASEEQDDLAKGSSNANKGLKILGKGTKVLGAAFKAMGIGALLALFAALWEALQRNQKIMDVVSTVVNTVSIVFNQVTDAIVGAYENLTKSNKQFDAMKIVVSNLIKVALAPLKATFLGLKAGVITAQLAFEKSFLGKGRPEEILKLQEALEETKEDLVTLGEETLESTMAVAENIGAAAEGIVTFAKDSVQGITEISVSGAIQQAEALTVAKNNFERLEILQQRVMLQLQTRAEVQRQIRDDENLSIRERIAANDELGKLLDEQAAEELDLINQRLEAAQLELETNQSSIELQNEILLLENEVLDVNERINGQRSEQLAQRNALEKEAIKERMDAEEHAKDVISRIYTASAKEQLQIERDQLKEDVAQTILSEEEKTAALLEIDKTYLEDVTALEDAAAAEQEKLDQERHDAKVDRAKDFLAIAQSVSSVIANFTQLRFENEMAQFEENQEAQLSQLELRHQEELDGFTGTEAEKQLLIEQYEAEKLQLERDGMTKKSQLEHDAAVANKRIKLIDAAIAGGLAILASMAQLGPIAGPIVGGILVAANIGLIAAQKIPPAETFAKGGVLNGPSHANGGIMTPFGEVEGGEGVINKASMANPDLRNLASAANEAGGGTGFGNGGGINLSPATIGSIVTGINSKKVTLNMNELNETNEDIELIEQESVL